MAFRNATILQKYHNKCNINLLLDSRQQTKTMTTRYIKVIISFFFVQFIKMPFKCIRLFRRIIKNVDYIAKFGINIIIFAIHKDRIPLILV